MNTIIIIGILLATVFVVFPAFIAMSLWYENFITLRDFRGSLVKGMLVIHATKLEKSPSRVLLVNGKGTVRIRNHKGQFATCPKKELFPINYFVETEGLVIPETEFPKA